MTSSSTNYEEFPLKKVESMADEFQRAISQHFEALGPHAPIDSTLKVSVSSEPYNRLHLAAARRLTDGYNIAQCLGSMPLFEASFEASDKSIVIILKPLGS